MDPLHDKKLKFLEEKVPISKNFNLTFYFYVLKSTKNNSYYIGYTKNINNRLTLHNTDRVTATRGRGPWQVFYTESFPSEIEAVYRERQVKRWKSRMAIGRLKFLNEIADPRFCNSDRIGNKIGTNHNLKLYA